MLSVHIWRTERLFLKPSVHIKEELRGSTHGIRPHLGLAPLWIQGIRPQLRLNPVITGVLNTASVHIKEGTGPRNTRNPSTFDAQDGF